MIKPLICLAFLLAITSCDSNSTEGTNSEINSVERSDTKYRTEKYKEVYSIDIPDYMKSTNSINYQATTQFSNLFKGKYITVVSESKRAFSIRSSKVSKGDSVIDVYLKMELETFGHQNKVIRKSEIVKQSVNGLNGRLLAIDAKTLSLPDVASYWIGYIEGKDNLYTISVWTLEKRKSHYELEANEIITSFKELGVQ